MATEDEFQIPEWEEDTAPEQCAICRRPRKELEEQGDRAIVSGGFRVKVDGVSTRADICIRCISTLEELGAEVDYLYP